MKWTFSPAHRLARYNYAPRTAAFMLSFLVFAVLWIERGSINAWEITFATFTFLVYPHLAYLHARIAADSKRAELNNLYVDSLLLGAATAVIQFAVWPSVMLLSAICLNSAGYGYLGRLFRSLALFAAGAGILGAFSGYAIRLDVGPVVTALCIFGILGYVSWAGALSFVQNKNLVQTRDALRASAEQFRFIAEHVAELVSALDVQCRFLYASSAYAEHFGPEAVGSGADWLLLVHPDDRELARSFLNAILTSVSSKSILLRLVSAKGSSLFWECQGNPVRDKTGNAKMLVLVSRELMGSLSFEIEAIAQRRGKMADELQFHSMDEIHAYVKMELERQLALSKKKTEGWRSARNAVWLLLLVCAYLQYFLIDILRETLTLPTIEVSVPVPKNPVKSRT